MKSKIFLLLLVSFVTFSFTTEPVIEVESPTPTEVICITISDISDLENLVLEDDVSYNINIVWTGDAAYNASMNFQSIRDDVRTYYEDNWGKFPIHHVIDNNHESWNFSGITQKSNVEATMQSDPNVDVDDD